MLDLHSVPNEAWGVYPILFKIGSLNVESYAFFVGLAILIGLWVFYFEARKKQSLNEKTFYILIAALVGGALGAKIPIWIFHFKEIVSALPNILPLLSGRTIVGGLIGGTLAVIITKRYMGIDEKKGNLFAPAIALGIAIGRIGCFLRGCCYGIATGLPWGIDFGDGISRHPTQIYESLFALGLFFYLQKAKNDDPRPGQLFKILMISYFTFRFFIEFIRVEQEIFIGLTGFQLASLAVIIYYLADFNKLKEFINKHLLNR